MAIYFKTFTFTDNGNADIIPQQDVAPAHDAKRKKICFNKEGITVSFRLGNWLNFCVAEFQFLFSYIYQNT